MNNAPTRDGINGIHDQIRKYLTHFSRKCRYGCLCFELRFEVDGLVLRSRRVKPHDAAYEIADVDVDWSRGLAIEAERFARDVADAIDFADRHLRVFVRLLVKRAISVNE